MEIHRHECGYVDAMDFITSGCDALKAFLVAGHKVAFEEFRDPKPLEYQLGRNYPSYASLFAHHRNVSDLQMTSFLLQATIAAEFGRLIKAVPQGTNFQELTTILLGNILRHKTNAWALYDRSHQQCGSGLLISFPMPNHSCEPNSHQVYYGNSMVSTAVRPIREETTMSYGPTVGTMDVTERQARMRESYDFECDCN